VAAICGADATSFLNGMQASLAHEMGHSMLATDVPLCPQLGMNAWAAICLSPLLVGMLDLLSEPLILPLAAAGFTLTPGVIATFRNREHLTHRFHGILLVMISNKLIFPPYVLEKTIKAFFKISRS
jgi:hypothetical protein